MSDCIAHYSELESCRRRGTLRSPLTRRNGWFGERVGDALSLESLQSGADAAAALEPIQGRLGSSGGDGAVDRERRSECEAAVWPAAAQVDAQLLDDVTPNFGDRDAQAHLVGAANRESVDYLSLRAAGRFAAGGTASAGAARNGDLRAGSGG